MFGFLSKAIHTVVAALKNLPKILKSIIDYAKRIYDAVSPIIFGIISSLVKYLPSIIDMIVSLYEITKPFVTTILSIIVSNFPKILSFIKAYISGIFTLGTNIARVVKVLLKSFSDVFNKGNQMTITDFVNKIFNFINNLLSNKSFLESIYNTSKLIFTVLKTIGAVLSPIISSVSKLALALWPIINYVTSGLAKGLTAIINLVTGVVEGIVEKIKSILGIHSPSKVFMWIGAMCAAGLALGFANSPEGQKVIQAVTGIIYKVLNIVSVVLDKLSKTPIIGVLVSVF